MEEWTVLYGEGALTRGKAIDAGPQGDVMKFPDEGKARRFAAECEEKGMWATLEQTGSQDGRTQS